MKDAPQQFPKSTTLSIAKPLFPVLPKKGRWGGNGIAARKKDKNG